MEILFGGMTIRRLGSLHSCTNHMYFHQLNECSLVLPSLMSRSFAISSTSSLDCYDRQLRIFRDLSLFYNCQIFHSCIGTSLKHQLQLQEADFLGLLK